MRLLKRVLAFIIVLSITPILAQEGVDLIIDLSADVVALEEGRYEIVVNAIVTQQDGFVEEGRVIFETEWDGLETVVFLDDGATPVEHVFFVPEDYWGAQVEVFAEVQPVVDIFEFDPGNNRASVSVRIPTPAGQAPPNRGPQNTGPGAGLPPLPGIPPWLVYVLGFVVVAWIIRTLLSRHRFDFKLTLHNLQLRATQNPPANPQKGQYWIQKELAVEPTRWQLMAISVETEPKTNKRNAPKKFVEIISGIIDTRKRRREEEMVFWEYEAFDHFVAVSYPIKANFAWVDAKIKQVKLTVTFTLYRFDGTDWKEILKKSFSRRGTYHYVLPLESFPQSHETA